MTVFSVRAVRRQPFIQIPLDHLAVYKPFTRRAARVRRLRKLNKLLPRSARLNADRADRRPTIPLHHLSSVYKLEAFKEIAADIVSALRSQNPRG